MGKNKKIEESVQKMDLTKSTHFQIAHKNICKRALKNITQQQHYSTNKMHSHISLLYFDLVMTFKITQHSNPIIKKAHIKE